MNCKKSNLYILIIVVAIVIPILLMVLDLCNITNIIKFTSKYDWLGFIGAYISGVCTLWLGIISISQNETLEEVNKKMLKNDMISNCFSQIDIENINYLDKNFRKEMKYFGIDMITENVINKNNLYYFRIIIQIKDENHLPLVSARINKLELQYEFDDGMTIFNKNSKYKSNKTNETKLEVTPNNETISYYLPINILDNVFDLKQIDKSKELRIVAQIDIKNSFNVISKGEYTIVLSKKGKINNSDWTEYSLIGRKIYYNDITYKEENI